MSFERILAVIAASALLSGCHFFSKLNPDCHTAQDYQHALSAPPLKVPAGLDSPNTQGALVIPAVADAPPPPGPGDQCYDVPPRYKPAPSSRAASGG
ncbi:MAG TPA: hypothetical protein VN815_04845 [Steroidobacteraceae bacterium]|jgi:uncharacterized lipoprotein|nr:hypothetical protein [Steroidobacteraceae bacterium]